MTTPLHLNIALHYHACISRYAEHDPPHANSIATRKYKQDLIDAGLLKDRTDPEPDRYTRDLLPTDALEIYVRALCAVPFPVQRWVIPSIEG